MPNLLSIDRARKIAERVWLVPGPEPLRSRVIKLALHALITDPLNARLASAREIETGPAWGRTTPQPVHVFIFRRASAERLQRLRALLTTFLRAHDLPKFQERALLVRLIKQCPHMNLVAIERQLASIAEAWARHEEALKAAFNEPMVDHAQLTCTSGLVWMRVRSRAELNACGHALRNCCRRGTGMHERYTEAMAARQIEFWALRAPGGEILALALVNARSWEIVEARGFANGALLNQLSELDSLDASLVPLRRRAQRPDPDAGGAARRSVAIARLMAGLDARMAAFESLRVQGGPSPGLQTRN